MIIKKFQGKTENDAVEIAKKELGGNIVIMNVRNTKKKGIFSFLSPQQVEVTVALEEENERYGAGNGRQEKAAPKEERTREPLVFAALASKADQTAEEDKESQGKITRTDPAGQTSHASHVLEEKLDSLHSLLEQQLQKPEEEKDEKEEGRKETYRFMRLLYNTMLDNEVNEKYANQMIDEIEKTNKPNMPFDYVLSSTYQKMILKFGKPAVLTPAVSGPKVVFFVGPTGVGKTTTIAKIASRFCVEEHRKVALLTADTYRIAAAEQLRTYANILEVPFRVIYTKEEMEQAITYFKDYDMIMVDTAGHSHKNKAQRDQMNELIHSADNMAEKEVFLVLSATTKYRDLISIADSYREISDYKLIFTKLDETATLGNLLNLKLHTGAPLSYMTYGQNVPDDIEDFNPQKTVKQLLGGRK